MNRTTYFAWLTLHRNDNATKLLLHEEKHTLATASLARSSGLRLLGCSVVYSVECLLEQVRLLFFLSYFLSVNKSL